MPGSSTSLIARGDEIRLSLIAADPQSTTEDYLEEESDVIRSSFETNRARAKVSFAKPSTEDELLQYIAHARPQVLHFTGHGTPLAKVMLRTARGPFRRK